ncbi:hypothetical protein HU230_0024085 [Bradyrhizobium quebecense]|uniref:PHB de-polymerase C-terminal domain-containing protein n=1 Tax=Bradyrhizobium quebecense TaxID=2748629 RepID=A0A973WLX6_9BRAD|nr:hypothetical protein [Bradyrhizobium quebecense]UGA41461.1 hypothetical protein HU230_0024085 [Bradyrhizobium quebecense]
MSTSSSLKLLYVRPDSFLWRGNENCPETITATSLLTVEGEFDDTCGLGQTQVAHHFAR